MGISPDSNKVLVLVIKLSFQIGLHEKDKRVIKFNKSYFVAPVGEGVGNITKLAGDSVLYRVTSIEELKLL